MEATGDLSFERDVRPLFRDVDIEEMAFALNLADHEDVREHGEEIHARVADGSMPCDDAWTADRVALFRRWLDEGARP